MKSMFDSPTQERKGIMRAVNYSLHSVTDRIARSLTYKGRVIDLGCGSAPYKDIILEQADEYVGVDWKHSLHDQSNVDVLADLMKGVPLDSECADTLVSFQVMEHLPDTKFFLSECHRLLKPGGRIFITVPFMWQVHEAPYDYYRFTRHGLDYLLKHAGFDEIDITEYACFWQMWVLKFNYHTMRFARGPFKYALAILWIFGQMVSVLLDRIDPHPQDAIGYVVKAIKV